MASVAPHPHRPRLQASDLIDLVFRRAPQLVSQWLDHKSCMNMAIACPPAQGPSLYELGRMLFARLFVQVYRRQMNHTFRECKSEHGYACFTEALPLMVRYVGAMMPYLRGHVVRVALEAPGDKEMETFIQTLLPLCGATDHYRELWDTIDSLCFARVEEEILQYSIDAKVTDIPIRKIVRQKYSCVLIRALKYFPTFVESHAARNEIFGRMIQILMQPLLRATPRHAWEIKCAIVCEIIFLLKELGLEWEPCKSPAMFVRWSRRRVWQERLFMSRLLYGPDDHTI